ncbi:MAG TPA: ABC transporter ATP-binding protein [Methanomassiliicoccales archaeon]|jgi:putative ABC transport system ATP-binding protein
MSDAVQDLAIKAVGLSKEYDLKSHKVLALRNASFEVRHGESIAIKGPSGSGKTTLLTMIGLLDWPTSGSITIDGVDLTKIHESKLHEVRQKKIGFVFQSFNLMPYLTAEENVELPMELGDLTRSQRKERALELLGIVGLAERVGHRPTKLSAGEQQRVAIARALANGPSILLADEPTGNLDSKSKKEIVKLFNRLRREQGMTVIIVTHDDKVANDIGKVIRMRNGRLLTEKDQEFLEDENEE